MFIVVDPPPEELEQLFDAAPWVEIRPGRFEQRVVFRGLVYYRAHTECQDCGRVWPQPECPMLHDVVWEKAGLKDGIVCVPCLESRLKRSLVRQDLTNVPMNVSWLRVLPDMPTGQWEREIRK